MMRLLASLIIVLGLAAAAAAAEPPHPAPAPQPAAPAISRADAQSALDVLRDDARRKQLIAVLEAIVRAAPAEQPPPAAAPTQPAPAKPAAGQAAAAPPAAGQPAPAQPAAGPAAVPIPLAPDSVGAQVLNGVTTRLATLSNELVTDAMAVADVPLLGRWLVRFAVNPERQAQALSTAWRLLVVLAAALAIEYLVARALRRPAASIAAAAPEGRVPAGEETEAEGEAAAEAGQTEKLRRKLPALLLLKRLPFALLHAALELLPIVAFLAVGYVLAGSALADGYTTRLVIVGVVHAYAAWRTVMVALRLLVAPGVARIRLVRVSEAGAAYLVRWTRRIAAVAVFGYAIAEIGLLFGLYYIAYEGLLKLVSLAATICLVIVVLQTRAPVAERMRPPPERTGWAARLRSRAAAVWHFFAIFYLLALWVVWALDVPNGSSRLLWLVVSGILVVTLARFVAVLTYGTLDKALRLAPETALRHPELAARLASYHPVARALITALIVAVAALALFEAWGIDVLAWFTGASLGSQLVGALGTIAVTLAISLAVWESANAAIQRHLARLAREAQAARSARVRTLLPMLRTTLLIGISVVAGLMVLSEIGVNIAPLLAGAGVVGLAIGFGSQKLVQDIITGLFLLLENTMQVGDVVSLGGLSGTVEALSIRTIRLRALDGSVHIVPFSAVTTVTNQTRDFAYAVVDVSIGLNEDPDRVADLLRDVARAMRQEERWEIAVRDDLDVMGVDRFLDMALVLRTRIRTLPGQRWAVARELNQRIKARFDELAIESPWTSHRVLSGTPAPAAGGE